MRSLPRRLFERPGLYAVQVEEARWHETAHDAG
jgi:hypothetical protein